jgi:uncharacterized repeat protein (TIGR03809 family)
MSVIRCVRSASVFLLTGFFMTYRNVAPRDADVLARWCALAEQRLEYLTELFESGRWRRFHGELAFLENIKEAKAAVETWRELSTPGADARSVVASLAAARPLQLRPSEPIRLPVREAEIIPFDVPQGSPVVDLLALEQALDVSEPLPDLDMVAQRYPLLRNAL